MDNQFKVSNTVMYQYLELLIRHGYSPVSLHDNETDEIRGLESTQIILYCVMFNGQWRTVAKSRSIWVAMEKTVSPHTMRHGRQECYLVKSIGKPEQLRVGCMS